MGLYTVFILLVACEILHSIEPPNKLSVVPDVGQREISIKAKRFLCTWIGQAPACNLFSSPTCGGYNTNGDWVEDFYGEHLADSSDGKYYHNSHKPCKSPLNPKFTEIFGDECTTKHKRLCCIYQGRSEDVAAEYALIDKYLNKTLSLQNNAQ